MKKNSALARFIAQDAIRWIDKIATINEDFLKAFNIARSSCLRRTKNF